MARIEIHESSLTILVEGFDQVLGMRTRVTVPLAHITGVAARPDLRALMQMEAGTALRGALMPGRLIVGTFPLPEGAGLVFCDVHDPARSVAIELRHDRFRRILVEISDETPEAVCERIVEACAAHG